MSAPLMIDASTLIPFSDAVQSINDELQAICDAFKALPDPRSTEQHSAFHTAYAAAEKRFQNALWLLAVHVEIQISQAKRGE